MQNTPTGSSVVVALGATVDVSSMIQQDLYSVQAAGSNGLLNVASALTEPRSDEPDCDEANIKSTRSVS
jgi:hypothetical protein